MATCDKGHEAITFESQFSALCPLCKVIEAEGTKAAAVERELRDDLDEQQGELESLQAQLDEVRGEYAAYRKANPEAAK